MFGARFAFMQSVTGLTQDGDRLVITLPDTPPVRASAVLLATGARYRRIDVPSLEALTGAGVFYGGPISEALGLAGREVYVVGGANSAGQAVLHLARYAKRVTLVVRAGSLRAGMSDYLISQIEATDNIEVRLGAEVVDGGGEGQLEWLEINDRETGERARVDAAALFLLIGAQPYTDWLPPEIERDQQGFVLTGANVSPPAWSLDRPAFDLETSVPGVFAAGDVRHGSVKRVASAVGEGSIAVQLIHQLFAVTGHTPRGRSAGTPKSFV